MFSVFFFLIIICEHTAAGDSDPSCTKDSTEDNIISPVACGKFGIVTSRYYDTYGNKENVTVQYMVNSPTSKPKALVVLFDGGNGDTGILGNASTGKLLDAGSNFLVRSAQLFAEQGYLAVAIDWPSDHEGDSYLEFDKYRVSPAHTQDIVSVISAVNKDNLPVFLAGTSRGVESAVADNKLSIGILLSDPVTSGKNLYLGDPEYANLQASSVRVPMDILVNNLDECRFTSPNAAKIFYLEVKSFGIKTNFDKLSGGFSIDDSCTALSYHGFLGIEQEAVKITTQRMNETLQNIQQQYAGNLNPIAKPAIFFMSSKKSISIDLATLASDNDKDNLSYSLVYPESTMGAKLSISGSKVTYQPVDPNIVDGFVYVVSDGRGGKSSAIITVEHGQVNQSNASPPDVSIPSWIKNNAKLWSEGQINDSDFVKGIQFLIQQRILQIPSTPSSTNSSQSIPNWVKSDAGFWAQGQISDDVFIKGIQYLISNGMIKVS